MKKRIYTKIIVSVDGPDGGSVVQGGDGQVSSLRVLQHKETHIDVCILQGPTRKDPNKLSSSSNNLKKYTRNQKR